MLKQEKSVASNPTKTQVEETKLSGDDLRKAAQQVQASKREITTAIKNLSQSDSPELRAFASAMEQALLGKKVENFAAIKSAARLVMTKAAA